VVRFMMPNGEAERGARCGLSLALDRDRVRSSAVLGRNPGYWESSCILRALYPDRFRRVVFTNRGDRIVNCGGAVEHE
jgi:hypothetical protein